MNPQTGWWYVLKRLLTGTVVYSVVALAFIFVDAKTAPFDCMALTAFDGGSSGMRFLGVLLLYVLVFLGGFLAYCFISLWRSPNPIIFFVLIALGGSFPLMKSIGQNVVVDDIDENIKRRICEKAEDNSMEATFIDLTPDEYLILTKNCNWIPELPPKTEAITVEYYRDDFLGDYNLTIGVLTSTTTEFDTTVWAVVDTISSGLIQIRHNKFQN